MSGKLARLASAIKGMTGEHLMTLYYLQKMRRANDCTDTSAGEASRGR